MLNRHKKAIFITAIGLLFVGGGLLFLSISSPSALAQPRKQPLTNVQKDNVVRKAFTDRFGSGRGKTSNTAILALIGCTAVVATLTLILVGRYHRSRSTKDGYYSRSQLFRDLCKAHEFTNYQQTILRSIAKELQLNHPAMLFIEPKHLEMALVEPVVHHSQESIRQIFNELFSSEIVPTGIPEEEQNSWFAWTHITTNPEADQLKKGSKTKESPREIAESSEEIPPTQQWDPSLWDDVHRAAKGQGLPRDPNDTNSHATEGLLQAPIYQSPPLRKEVEERENSAYHFANQKTATVSFASPSSPEPDRTVSERTGYKPKYPETQDAATHQAVNGEVRSTIGEKPMNQSSSSGGPGAQIFSSLIHSVSDVSNDLAFSSIRNHLTRSLSLSPQTLGEIKPNTNGLNRPSPMGPQNSTLSVPLNEILVSTKPKRVPTQTQVEPKTQPKVVIKPIELKVTDLKPPLVWDEKEEEDQGVTKRLD